MGRVLTFSIFRFNPEDPESTPHMDTFNLYELERCTECGCCVAACGRANMRPDFMGAVAFNRIARFMADPRDKRKTPEYFEVVGTEEGIFGCLGLLGCEDVCPKNIPLQDQLGIPRRKMGWSAVSHLFSRSAP